MAKGNLQRIKKIKTAKETRDEIRERAIPEVKKLVKRFDRQTIGWCVKKLAEYERKVKKVAEAEKELAQMKAGLD